MGDPSETLLLTATGCATGLFWSAVAGQADLTTARGWGRAMMGCAGSSLNTFGIYSLTDHFTKDQNLARNLALGWVGVQSAASFTNWLGHRHGWGNSPAFQAVAFPLNYMAAPISSTAGILVGTTGSVASGFSAEVRLFGGTLIFNHRLCQSIFGSSAFQTGAVGHCYSPHQSNPELTLHESGHSIQFSTMGDLGMWGVVTTDGLVHLLANGHIPRSRLSFELWADDISKSYLPYYPNLGIRSAPKKNPSPPAPTTPAPPASPQGQ